MSNLLVAFVIVAGAAVYGHQTQDWAPTVIASLAAIIIIVRHRRGSS